MFLFLVLLGVAFEVIGDVLFKLSAVKDTKLWLLVGYGSYWVGTFFWSLSVRYEDLGKAISVSVSINAAAVILLSLWIFDEKVSPVQWLGVGLAFVSLYLILYTK